MFFKKKVINQTVKDFIEGSISPKDFLALCRDNDEIFDWIQSIVPKRKTCYKNTTATIIGSQGKPIELARSEIVPYDIRLVVQQYLDMDGDTLGSYLNIHTAISKLIKEAFPKESIKVSDKLQEQCMLMLEACPQYIGGREVNCSGVLEELLNNIPEGLSMDQQINWYRSQVKEIFHITSNNYPRWIQDAEWPINNSRPMRFVSQEKASSEGVYYIFEDVETGEIRKVFQCT